MILMPALVSLPQVTISDHYSTANFEEFGSHSGFSLSAPVDSHFSHPFLGTYEVVQFFELGNLKGTHPRVVYELHTNPMVSWDANPIPYPSLSNTKSPHTIPLGS